jgi:hypothetical protein
MARKCRAAAPIENISDFRNLTLLYRTGKMKLIKVEIEQCWLTAAELAEALGITIARVGQLNALGVFQKGKDGFEAQFSVINYERYLANPRRFD